ncbi:protein kinase family protein [Streptomyces sp. MBT62]|uniref:protein kinase family protein n=1 Tax=Streptomyces sp. MBT62 TaxID=2800410 RepID=UPI00190AF57B|nr:protein kinase family protein [Streptomyces sp. MBT62]MBK3562443.1 protein kinase family protein [Streptomyces sp. MBT62]
MSRTARIAAHSDIATSLALLSDHELAELVGSARPLGSGIGGRSALIEVAGRKVFVKRMPLTDVERRAENVRSTANVFAAPAYCHYGIGALPSPGFGVWRELAVHEMTTNWALSDRFSGFPLLHHWRILPDPERPLPEELSDAERTVAYWGAGRAHIEALRTASASLTLFMEHLPLTLHDWLPGQLRGDDPDTACTLVERGLDAVTGFLREQRLLHFDVHFGNILTDGQQLYLADYGLALSPRFRLAADERSFYDRHLHYDRAYAFSYLAHWLVVDQYGHGQDERLEFLRACADGKRPEGIPDAAAALISRYARLGLTVGDFNRRFKDESRLTPYPSAEELGYNSSTLSA